ncbi:hypothetical protein V8G54_017699 [Vigna mungo]|uniref:Uncharacterized protein n=1 Tax=Vigna mungo TaxID=3915 RepID=A0AAQ3NMN3_VIGMU
MVFVASYKKNNECSERLSKAQNIHEKLEASIEDGPRLFHLDHHGIRRSCIVATCPPIIGEVRRPHFWPMKAKTVIGLECSGRDQLQCGNGRQNAFHEKLTEEFRNTEAAVMRNAYYAYGEMTSSDGDTRKPSTIGPITRGMIKKLQDEHSPKGQNKEMLQLCQNMEKGKMVIATKREVFLSRYGATLETSPSHTDLSSNNGGCLKLAPPHSFSAATSIHSDPSTFRCHWLEPLPSRVLSSTKQWRGLSSGIQSLVADPHSR